ncbi:hypothetical protein Q8F55_001570 [Vanrija albida]|uniref:Uncharacterized protein n=1 Tax=Vanrija albida TaxID=181172 RepID=A0ABR3QGJ8_9TREE
MDEWPRGVVPSTFLTRFVGVMATLEAPGGAAAARRAAFLHSINPGVADFNPSRPILSLVDLAGQIPMGPPTAPPTALPTALPTSRVIPPSAGTTIVGGTRVRGRYPHVIERIVEYFDSRSARPETLADALSPPDPVEVAVPQPTRRQPLHWVYPTNADAQRHIQQLYDLIHWCTNPDADLSEPTKQYLFDSAIPMILNYIDEVHAMMRSRDTRRGGPTRGMSHVALSFLDDDGADSDGDDFGYGIGYPRFSRRFVRGRFMPGGAAVW